SSLGGADPPGVGAAGLGLTTAGVVLQSSGATTASLRPHKDLWQGLSREGFVEAARWQGRATALAGRATTYAGAALGEYAKALEHAHHDTLTGGRIADRGRHRYARARRAWTLAAAAGDAPAASEAVTAARTGLQEHRDGTALQHQARTQIQDAATTVITRLQSATDLIEHTRQITLDEVTGPGWTQADLLLAPFTIPTGLTVGPVGAITNLATAIATNPHLRHQILTTLDGGPLEWATRAGAATATFGITQGQQLTDAAHTGGLHALIEETTNDTTKAAHLAGDLTGITDLTTGLRHGDLLRAATGAGAIIDLTHGAYALTTGATRGLTHTDDILTLNHTPTTVDNALRTVTDDELDLVVGDTDITNDTHNGDGSTLAGDEPDIVGTDALATTPGTSAHRALGHPDDDRLRLTDFLHHPTRLWTPDSPPGTATTSSGLHVPTDSYLHDIPVEDPVLDRIAGAGWDPDANPSPSLVETVEDPFTGIVRLVTDQHTSTASVIGATGKTTTLLANAHAVATIEPGTGRTVRDQVMAMMFPRPGAEQYSTVTALHRSRVELNPLWGGGLGRAVDDANDLAIVHLDLPPPADTFVFPLPSSAPSLTPGDVIHTAGYPRDVDRFVTASMPGRRRGLVVSRGRAVNLPEYTTNRLRLGGENTYGMWTSTGMSGAPIWTVGGDGSIDLVGVHAWGIADAQPGRRGPFEPLPSFADLTASDGNPNSMLSRGVTGGGPQFTQESWRWILWRAQSR
ncbi:MAG: trypsin-like serine protease, partial [Dermatophilaceae bacterium]